MRKFFNDMLVNTSRIVSILDMDDDNSALYVSYPCHQGEIEGGSIPRFAKIDQNFQLLFYHL